MKKIILLLVSAFVSLSFVGCKTNNSIQIVYVNWAEGVAMSNLTAYLIEENFDIDVELKLADVGGVFVSVANKDADFFMDVWTPVTHKNYLERYGNRMVEVATVFDEAKLGLVVPKYVHDSGITTIEDFHNASSQFNNQIIGIDSGAGIMTAAAAAIEAYSMNEVTLMTSSETSMITMLKNAIEKEEFIAVTGWAPHWIFDRWDLEFLTDSKGSFGETEQIKIYSRQGFASDRPEINAFLSNISFSMQELGSIMSLFADNTDTTPKELAKQWAQDNQALVDSWLQA